MATWAAVRVLGGAGEGPGGKAVAEWWTGVVLIFSGGTFLFVAMHSMLELRPSRAVRHHGAGGQGDGGLEPGYALVDRGEASYGAAVAQNPRATKAVDVVLMVVGLLLPLVTQVGHAHAHG